MRGKCTCDHITKANEKCQTQKDCLVVKFDFLFPSIRFKIFKVGT